MMKIFVNIRLGIVLVFIIIFFGCVRTNIKNESMLTLCSDLTKLSSAVESEVRYPSTSENISDSKLLKLATEHDHSLLTPFSNYTIKLLKQNRHAIMLICSGDGKQALIEDVGCTAKPDKHWWKIQPAHACEFTLTVSDSCEVGNN